MPAPVSRGLVLALVMAVLVGLKASSGGQPGLAHVALHPSSDAGHQDPCHLYGRLYREYAADVIRVRQLATQFCTNATVKASGMPHGHHCLTGDMESEVLYLRLRHFKPAAVFEVSSALGYSTMWILAALEDNGFGVLHSFDIFNTPFPFVLGDGHRKRWVFHKGDMTASFMPVADAVTPDYLHIDTCHNEACIKWYLTNVLGTVAEKTSRTRSVQVSMHDIYATYYPVTSSDKAQESKRWPLPEGVQVFEWLAYSGAAAHAHTLALGVGKVGSCVRTARQAALQSDATVKIPTYQRLRGDLAASIYFELLPLTNSCEQCLV